MRSGAVDLSGNRLEDGCALRAAIANLFHSTSNNTLLDLRGNPLVNTTIENLTSLESFWIGGLEPLDLEPRALAGLPNLIAVNSHTPGVLNLSRLNLSTLPVPLVDDSIV
jgi:hypothetical protein